MGKLSESGFAGLKDLQDVKNEELKPWKYKHPENPDHVFIIPIPKIYKS